jgi:hypothetical protein
VLKGNETALQVATGETVRTTSGLWYRRVGSAGAVNAQTESFDESAWRQLTIFDSNKGLDFAFALSGKFYVVKPKDMALPTLVYANVANQLFDERSKVVAWMTSHAGNAEAIARYQALLDSIDQQLQKLGLTETAPDGKTLVPKSQFDQFFLKLPTIVSAPGSIFISADGNTDATRTVEAAVNSGRLKAHGEAQITVVNNTLFGLLVNDISIRKNSRVDVSTAHSSPCPPARCTSTSTRFSVQVPQARLATA